MNFRSAALLRRIRWRWVVLLIVLLAGGALLLRGSGGTQGRLAAIRAQGYPVSVEDIAAALGTNAARARQNVEQLDAFALAIRVDTTRRPPRGLTNAASELDWARAQLTPENLAQFDRLHTHLNLNLWAYNDFSKGIGGLTIKYLISAKTLANHLQVEAMSAAILGDTQQSAAAVEGTLKVSRSLNAEPLTVYYLVASAVDAIAANAAEFSFSRAQWTDSELRSLGNVLLTAEGTNTLQASLAGERAYNLSVIQSDPLSLISGALLNSGAGGTTGPLTQTLQRVLATAYITFLRSGDRNHFLDHFDDLMRIATLSGPQGRPALTDFESRLGQERMRWRYPLSHWLLPTVARAANKEWRRLATLRCARTACAVERFRGQNGRLPERLDELVPRFLDRIPDDPITGTPLQYRVHPLGYVVYSVGQDGADDGGVEFARRPKNRNDGWDHTFTVER